MENWSELELAFGLRETNEPETLVISITRLIHALRAVEQEEVLDRLHAQSPFLPTTWEVISRLRSKEPFEVSFQAATAAIELVRPKPYWAALWEELTVYLWIRVQNSMPTKNEVEAAAHRFHDEALRLESGVKPTLAVEATEPGSAGTSDEANSEPGFAEDFTWLRARGAVYHFKPSRQTAVIRALVQSWQASGEQDGCGLHVSVLREKADCAAEDFRMGRIFQGHPVLGTVLRSNGKGCWALYLTDPAS